MKRDYVAPRRKKSLPVAGLNIYPGSLVKRDVATLRQYYRERSPEAHLMTSSWALPEFRIICLILKEINYGETK